MPFEDFFPEAPGKIGELLKTNSYFFEQASFFFFLMVTGVSKQELLFSLTEEILINVDYGMLFSRLFVFGS